MFKAFYEYLTEKLKYRDVTGNMPQFKAFGFIDLQYEIRIWKKNS